MDWRKVTGRLVSRAVLITVLLVSAAVSPGIAGAEDASGIVLRYSPKEGQVLKYKGSTTNEAFMQGNEFVSVHSDVAEIVFARMVEEGKIAVRLNYLESADKRGMAGSALEVFESPIRTIGTSIEVIVDASGKVIDTIGQIPGLRRGEQTTEYVDKWFFELPSDTLATGFKWTKELPEKDAATAEKETSEEVTGLIGTIVFELKKIEKKDGIDVAIIKYKGDLKIHNDSEQGALDGEVKVEGDAKIAVDGGYPVELNSSFEMKGKMVTKDEYTGKETEHDVQQLRYSEIKLEK